MFDDLYKELTKISQKYDDCKIIFGKVVVKRFSHIWHTGIENFSGMQDVISFDDYKITAQNHPQFEKIKQEIVDILDK